tara:strand:+ start:565 stop:750 length:186 start_codon:yes stop_codon:yes gene_type:complete
MVYRPITKLSIQCPAASALNFNVRPVALHLPFKRIYIIRNHLDRLLKNISVIVPSGRGIPK